MLGMFSLLPLMKGWGYKFNTYNREVKNGEVLEVSRLEQMGYLIQANVISDDAYGGFDLQFQGADLTINSAGIINAQTYYSIGSLEQDPSGFVQRYYRPNPQSTAGVYVSGLTTMGFQGSTWPYVPTTIVTLRLEKQSTQAKATVAVTIVSVIITDKKQFIKSLRALIGANIIQEIDPALLVSGLQEVTELGWSEKTPAGNKP